MTRTKPAVPPPRAAIAIASPGVGEGASAPFGAASIETTTAGACEGSPLAPVHPGEILMEDFLRPLGIGTTLAAQRMGLPRTRIERVVRGDVGITADTALRLEAFLGAPARTWLNLQALYELDVAHAKGDALLVDIRPWTAAE